MDLLNPDTGDVIDRITVLHLKLVRAHEDHWAIELSGLYEKLRALSPEPDGVAERVFTVRELRSILELMAANAAIWQATDEVNTARDHVARAGSSCRDVRDHAERAYIRAFDWNTLRCGVVRILNDALGRGAKREKV